LCYQYRSFSLCSLDVVVAQDQSPPYGMDKGIWVLKDVKPDFETQDDTDAYYNNKVDISETSVKGSLSWRDSDCSGTEWGTSSWEELPLVLEPVVGQNTTLIAEVGGSQSCSGRHVNAYTKLAVGDRDLNPIADVSFDSSDPKPAPVSVKVPWEGPWGKIGDTLTVTIVANVPGAAALHHYLNYIYAYQAEAPSIAPNTSELSPKTELGWKSETKEVAEVIDEPCPGECVDSGARISSISREVEVFHCWDVDSRSYAGSGTVLCAGDHILTGEDSNAIVTFSDLSSLMVKPESEITIIAPPANATKLEIISGKLKMNVQRVLRGDTLEVRSNLAVTSIKGTTIVCEVTESSSTLKVLEGTASFTSTSTGEEILVSAGEMATATVNGLSLPQSFDVDAENASWVEFASQPDNFVRETYTSGSG
jgi:hypothetical protein